MVSRETSTTDWEALKQKLQEKRRLEWEQLSPEIVLLLDRFVTTIRHSARVNQAILNAYFSPDFHVQNALRDGTVTLFGNRYTYELQYSADRYGKSVKY